MFMHKQIAALCKFIVLSLILLAFTHCKTVIPPGWVQQQPVDQSFYIGIGIVQKIPGQTNHIAKARENALNEISSNISVSLLSESNLRIVQEAGMHQESFYTIINTQTKADLEGYELVDVWENKNEFRVYYRLSKSYYHELLRKKLEQAIMRAVRLFEEGQNAENSGNIKQALSFYLQATAEIANYWGIGLEIPGRHQPVFIDTEVYIRIKELLSRVKIDAKPLVVKSRFLEAPEVPVLISTSYSSPSGNSAIEGIPVTAIISKGKAALNQINAVDASGSTTLFVNRAESIGITELKAFVDLKVLSGLSDQMFAKPVFASLSEPSVNIFIEVEPVRVFLEPDEILLGKSNSPSVTAAKIAQALTSNGWVIASNTNESEFILKINASARVGTERAGIHTAFADGSISLIRNLGKEELYTGSISQVSGAGRDYESAARLALVNLAERFIGEMNDAFNISISLNVE